VYNISISSKSTLTFWLCTLEKFPEEKFEVWTLLLKWGSGTAGVTGDWLAVVIRIITCEDLRLLPYAEDQLLQISVVIYLFRECWYHFKYTGQFHELFTAVGTKISYYNISLWTFDCTNSFKNKEDRFETRCTSIKYLLWDRRY